MPYCPECGGEMHYDARLRRYICKSCGLSLTSQELIELRDELRPDRYADQDERKKRKKEYLDWWVTRKE